MFDVIKLTDIDRDSSNRGRDDSSRREIPRDHRREHRVEVMEIKPLWWLEGSDPTEDRPISENH